MTADSSAPVFPARVESLDQFRGYTVAGMILVNDLGRFAALPYVLKHHNTYCSYADTIMPQFFFAVGYAYRLTLLRRIERSGPRAAYGHALRRALGLLLLGFVVYHLDGEVKTWAQWQALGVAGFLGTAFRRDYFQTLVHIALASIWVMPAIAGGPLLRLAWLVGSAAGHVALSHGGYYTWVMTTPGIDGGPLGFLSWSIPLLAGSFAFDVTAIGGRSRVARLALMASILMALGYGLTALDGRLDAPPFVPPRDPVDLWTMSQRAGSVSYQTFAAGFSTAVYAAFVLASDVGRFRLGLFRTLGRNALVAYLLHPMVASAFNPYMPQDAPGPFVAAGFALEFGLTYLLLRFLEKNGLFVKL